MTWIDPRAKVWRHIDRLARWEAGETPAPVTLEWDLTNVCSLGCQSCHFAYTHVAGPWTSKPPIRSQSYSDTGRTADTRLVTRALTETATAGVRAVVWSGGGEPTLHHDFAAIVRHADASGLDQGLYTLGGHLDSDRLDAVRALSWVVVSLDAADSETYAREKKVDGARYWSALEGISGLVSLRRPVVGVSFLLHRLNWRRAEEMLSLARSLGATYATFRPTIVTNPQSPGTMSGDLGWVTEAMPTLEALATEPDVEIDPPRFLAARDWHSHGYQACRGVRLLTQITPDGRVWVCPNRRGLAGSELGDLHRESFAAIWARHPGRVTDFSDCRAMCRLHLVNQSLAALEPRPHEAFV